MGWGGSCVAQMPLSYTNTRLVCTRNVSGGRVYVCVMCVCGLVNTRECAKKYPHTSVLHSLSLQAGESGGVGQSGGGEGYV